MKFSKLGIFFICLVRIMPSLLKIYNIIYTINFLENSVNLIKDEIVDDLVYQNEIQKEKENNDQKNIIDIEVKNLTYNYPNSPTQVLENVNFNFKKARLTQL